MTHDRKSLIAPPLASLPPLPHWLVQELRSDHAGETGAVMIYRGILAVARDPGLRDFAARHGATEQGHLDLLNELLAPGQRSKLLLIWKVAGFLTGFLPALFGPRAVHVTIDAVESFVDHHYQQQLDRLDADGIHPEIRSLLAHCQQEEIHHRDEARELHGGASGWLLGLWGRVVGAWSAAAVEVARRI